ncbi:MOSC domain-containing protein [Kitasatospora cheerisanensis]|uniref:Molybdenum cofactor biosysynthesis protein n=1 Tax=Kitasatospora cheerisanensis KCTC 2395 TaxID=1348663 RepID=A0A066Z8T9_9ACTN|nr:MOSC N-terminal beta barrel domain-containing protein [Kitasatospora cheerisanensis]KDN86595.1 molybdenum cofactor biosysynthesis protein [Kitasatospora cheerisanensis KCTC 2395]
MPHLASLHLYPVKSMYRLSPPSADVQPWGLAGDRRWMLVDAEGVALTQRDEPSIGRFRPLPSADGSSLTLTAPDGATHTLAVPTLAGGAPEATVSVFGTVFSAATAAEDTSAWLAERLPAKLGEVRLVHLDRPEVSRPINPAYAAPDETVSMADGYPLLVTSLASLAELNARIAEDHPGDERKGAALPMERFRPNLVVAGTEPWAEDGWRRIRVGGLEFRVAKPCGRCVVTTTDQETGERRGPEPLRALGRHHRFGQKLVFGQNLIPVRPAAASEVLGTLAVGDGVEVLEAVEAPLPDRR